MRLDKRQESVRVKAALDSDGNVAALANTVKLIQAVLPGEVSNQPPWTAPFYDSRTDQFVVWESYSASRARTFQIRVRKMKDVKEVKKAILYERSEKADHASRNKRWTVVAGEAQSVEGVGGECLSFSLDLHNVQPMRGDRSRLFRVSGVRMLCGVRNVTISIQWQGMDYSSPLDTKRGRGLDYEVSKQQAIGVMKPIVASLSPRG